MTILPSEIRINKIEIYKLIVDLKDPFVISLGPLKRVENIIILITTNKGHKGFGESSPFPTIHGETMETGFIVGQYLARYLIDKNPLDFEHSVNLIDSLIYGNSSIKSALEIAILDIASQHANLPLYKFLNGKNNKTMLTDYTVSLNDVSKMVEDALKIKQRGFQIIKVKLGEHKDKDISRIKAIRDAIGISIPIRIDANQGWNAASAIEILKTLAPFNVQHCEEPIPRWAYMELPKLREQSPIPIMVDESCFDHHDAKRLIQLNACDLVNIKLGKSGILKSQKIVRLAESCGIKLQVGGFLESRLGFTASAHFALTSENIVHYDFDTPLMFNEDPVMGGITYGANGTINVSEAPGLGATIDEYYLSMMEKVVIK